MKNKIFFLSLLCSCALTWTSCTDTVDYVPAELVSDDCQRMSFTSDGQSFEFTPSENKVVKLTVTREKTDADITVPLSLTRNDGGVFNIPESISFVAGQSSVDFNVEFPDVEVGKTYSFNVALPQEYVDPYSDSVLATSGASVQCIQWNDLGEGTFVSNMFQGKWGQQVYKASHTELYKFTSLYDDGKDILVSVSNGKAKVEEQLAFVHQKYGNVYVSGSGVMKDKTLTLVLGFVCSAGSFGEYQEIYTFK